MRSIYWIIAGLLIFSSAAFAQGNYRKVNAFNPDTWNCRSSAEKNEHWDTWQDYVRNNEGIYPSSNKDSRMYTFHDRLTCLGALVATGKNLSENRQRVRDEVNWIMANPSVFDPGTTNWSTLVKYQHIGGIAVFLQVCDPSYGILTRQQYDDFIDVQRPYEAEIRDFANETPGNIGLLATTHAALIGCLIGRDQYWVDNFRRWVSWMSLEPDGFRRSRMTESLGYSNMQTQGLMGIGYTLHMNNALGIPVLTEMVGEQNDDAFWDRHYKYDRVPYHRNGDGPFSGKRNMLDLVKGEALLQMHRPRALRLEIGQIPSEEKSLVLLGMAANALGDETPGWIRWLIKNQYEQASQKPIWSYVGGGIGSGIFLPSPRCMQAGASDAPDMSSSWISGYEIFLTSHPDATEYYDRNKGTMSLVANTESTNGKSMAKQGAYTVQTSGWGNHGFSGNYERGGNGTFTASILGFGDKGDSIPEEQEDHKGNNHRVPGAILVGSVESTDFFTAAAQKPETVLRNGFNDLAKPDWLDTETAYLLQRDVFSGDEDVLPYAIVASKARNTGNREQRVWDSAERKKFHSTSSRLSSFQEWTSHDPNSHAGGDKVVVRTSHPDRDDSRRSRTGEFHFLNTGYFQRNIYGGNQDTRLYRNRQQLQPGQTKNLVHVVQMKGTDTDGEFSQFDQLPSPTNFVAVEARHHNGDVRLNLIRFGECRDSVKRHFASGEYFARMNGKYGIIALAQTGGGYEIHASGGVFGFRVSDYGKTINRVLINGVEKSYRHQDGKIICDPEGDRLENRDFFESEGFTCMIYNNYMATLCPDDITAKVWGILNREEAIPFYCSTPLRNYGDDWPDHVWPGPQLPSMRTFLHTKNPAITEGTEVLWAQVDAYDNIRFRRVLPDEGQTAEEKYLQEGGDAGLLYRLDRNLYERFKLLLPLGMDIE